jgi:uncharacterized membrane protein
MEARGSLLAGLGAGTAIAYFLDPARGSRRRARVRDLVAHGANKGVDALGATLRDARNRGRGAAAAVRHTLGGDEPDDRVLVERVRAALGRIVSHPHAIDVVASGGHVSLSGPILKPEVKPLVTIVEGLSGVRSVINNLEEHKSAIGIPSLQGGAARPGYARRGRREEWSPTARVASSIGGAALVTWGATRRNTPGMLIAASGAMLMARAAANVDVRRLTGIGAGRRAVDIQKTITIDAPVEEVFAFWSCYENFPSFMSRVLEVRPSAREGQSHWIVAGPAGTHVEFDAEITELIPNEVLAWRTIDGSIIGHAGLARFEPTQDARTRVSVRMSYNPPGGWLGHGIASAFGVDPKSSLDADLARIKTLIETGRPPRDAARRDLV